MDNFVKVDIPDGTMLMACPVCHSVAEIWRVSDGPDAPTETAVCCSNGDAICPQYPAVVSGCLLYMPPQEFYFATIREAVNHWNGYGAALEGMRNARSLVNRLKTGRGDIGDDMQMLLKDIGKYVASFPAWPLTEREFVEALKASMGDK